jgi:predicted transposase/invertase (TIGR01784 family)
LRKQEVVEGLDRPIGVMPMLLVQWKKYRREMKKSAEVPWLMMLSVVDGRDRRLDETMWSELEEWAMNEQEIREALEEWEKLSVSPENRYAYEMRLKWLRDQLSNLLGERRAGLEEGLKKGREEGVRQVALEMLRAGLDHEMIMSVTKLSREELNELAKKTLDD